MGVTQYFLTSIGSYMQYRISFTLEFSFPFVIPNVLNVDVSGAFNTNLHFGR